LLFEPGLEVTFLTLSEPTLYEYGCQA